MEIKHKIQFGTDSDELAKKVLTKEKGTGDAIDAVLTNKYLGIPIYAVVMFLVFQISQTR